MYINGCEWWRHGQNWLSRKQVNGVQILLNCHAGYFIDDNAVDFTPWPLPEVSTQQTNFCVVV